MPDFLLNLVYLWDLNTRTGGGGGGKKCPPPPCGFSRITRKTKSEQRNQTWQYLFTIDQFYILLWNFCVPGHHQVRSPGRVTWPNLQKRVYDFVAAQWPQFLTESGFKFSERFIRPLDTYNYVYLGFLIYRWPGVRSRSWPLHYKSMGEKLKLFLLNDYQSEPPNSFRIMCLLGHSWWPKCQVLTSDPAKVVWGHLRSPWPRFLQITWDWARARDMT